MATNLLTHETAVNLFHYSPVTGFLYWKLSTNRKIVVGDRVGSIYTNPTSQKRYWQTTLGGKRYLVHRLIWFVVTGEWPENNIDHKDGNGLNNAWINIRQATASENQQNRVGPDIDSSTGVLGVCKKRDSFVAQITVNKKRVYLGTFKSIDKAEAAYLAAKRKYHPTAFEEANESMAANTTPAQTVSSRPCQRQAPPA